jgi:hypothetical protein
MLWGQRLWRKKQGKPQRKLIYLAVVTCPGELEEGEHTCTHTGPGKTISHRMPANTLRSLKSSSEQSQSTKGERGG